jgi:hypothetical protein
LSDLITDYYDMVQQQKMGNHFESMKSILTILSLDDDNDDDQCNNHIAIKEEEDEIHCIDFDFASSISQDERKFRQFVYDEYIKNRISPLNLLQEGIKLNGTL